MLEVTGMSVNLGGARILEDITLRVADCEVVAILGRNGAGKTTLLKSVMGLLKPHRGTVRYAEKEIGGCDPYQVCAAGIGYVPEERRIFARLTVAENLETGRRPAHSGLVEWDLQRIFELFPNLKTCYSRKGAHLSGGEQQMLTLARTLMGNPRLLLLDEPSEGIAPKIARALADAILELKAAGLAVCVAEQNIHFARYVADRVCIMERGRIRYEGTFADLDTTPHIYQEILGAL